MPKTKIKPTTVCSMAEDPLRPRAWRWGRVQVLSNNDGDGKRKRKASFDDEHILRGRDYLVRRDDIETRLHDNPNLDVDVSLNNLRPKWGDIMAASDIYASNTTKKWAIEALVLANMSAEDIAKEFGCDPSIIEAYEIYFYDVRSRLGNELFILDELLTPVVEQASGGNDQDFYWKCLAYWHGAPVLRAVMSLGKIPEDLQEQLDSFAANMQSRNVARASVSRQINQYSAHEIMEESLATQQINDNKQLSTTASQMASGAEMMLNAVGFAVASAKNIGTGGVETRMSATINELASGDNSGNNIKKTIPIPPDGILAAREAGKKVIDIEAEEQSDEKTNAVPESGATYRQPVVTSITDPAKVQREADAQKTIANKKQKILRKIKNKRR